jgi:hypothetical protein
MKVTVLRLTCVIGLALGTLLGQTHREAVLEKKGQIARVEQAPTVNRALNWHWQPQPRWLTGVDWGGAIFFGGLDYGENLFGSTLTTEQYVDVEIRFSTIEPTNVATYRRDLSYAYGGVGTFPGTAWDISNPDSPRRLNMCIAEDNGTKDANLIWDPDTSAVGGREYLFIMNSDYDGTGTTYNETLNGTTADVLYIFWPRVRPDFSLFDSDPALLQIMIRSDSLALVELYNRTDGDNWTSNTNWLQGNVSTWQGLEIDGGRVTELNLNTNNLVGIIPNEIGNLQKLQQLRLSKNTLDGGIPAEIGNLHNLENLEIADNNLSGSLPDELWNLENLKFLQLPRNILEGTLPYQIAQLQDLRILDLSSNGFRGALPSELTFIDSLESIYISNNRFVDIPDLSGMLELFHLYVYGNRLTFEDLEPNIDVPNFLYNPQDSIGEQIDTVLIAGSSFTLSVITGGSSNSFQWYKNNIIIGGATQKNYTISDVSASDAGVYTCRITNSIVTGMSLISKPATVRVFFPDNYDLVTIQDIQMVTNPAAYDTSALHGDTVRVQGLVLTNPTDLWLGSRFGTFIVDPVNQQSPWNGLLVFQDDSTVQSTNFSTVQKGMLCEFVGIVIEYNHLTEFFLLTDPPVPVSIISSFNPLPEPILLNCDSLKDRASAEKWESMWVRVQDVTIVENNLVGNFASVMDNTTALTYLGDFFNWFRTKFNAGSYTWPGPGSVLHANGFVRDELGPFGQIFNLNPRSDADIELLSQPLFVQLLYPIGDELWNEDTNHSIEWQASPPSAIIELLYSTDNGQNYTLIDTVENDGILKWRIPRTPSNTCKIKIVASDTEGNSVSDENVNVFTIVDVETHVHQTGALNHTIRNDGISGNPANTSIYPDEPAMEFPPGSGDHHLYIHQLFVGTVTGIDTVTALMYSDNYLPAEPINVEDRGDHIATSTSYSDKLGLGISVEEQTYATTGFVIFSYKLTNESSVTYSNFYIATFYDFDINDPQTNLSKYDAANRLAYMWDATNGWTTYAGARALNKDAHAFHRWTGSEDRNNPGFLYRKMAEAGFDDTSGDIQADYRFILSFGPYELYPGESVSDAFALVTGDGLDELIAMGQNAQTFWADSDAPSIGTKGQAITVTADVSDNRAVLEVNLNYRRGGNSMFIEVPMSYNGSAFEATIPINVPANDLAAQTIAGGTAETAYRMISAPLDFDNAAVTSILDEFGGYDNKQWRLYHDSGNNMVEYPNFQDIEVGKAYWLISRNTNTINFPGGITAGATDVWGINLLPGWTQVGLPFNYNIAWSDIIDASGQPVNIDGPYLYNNGTYSRPANLEPFRGYYVYNGTGGNFILEIPTKGAGASAFKPQIEDEWRIPILARIGQARDELNLIGASPSAKDGKDLYDHLEPPPIGNYISVYFPHYDWENSTGKYAEDIREESESGYVWDIDIQTNISDKLVELSFSELETAPDNFEIILIDPDLKIGQDLRKNSTYSIPSPGPDNVMILM